MPIKSPFKVLLFLALVSGLCILKQSASAQVVSQTDKKVSGKVTDENGAGLPGVSVTVKGTSKGTITDESGNFSIDVSGNNVVLVLSSPQLHKKRNQSWE